MKPTLSNLRHDLSRAAKAAIDFPPFLQQVITGLIRRRRIASTPFRRPPVKMLILR